MSRALWSYSHQKAKKHYKRVSILGDGIMQYARTYTRNLLDKIIISLCFFLGFSNPCARTQGVSSSTENQIGLN